MGFVDKVKDALTGHESQAEEAIDKGGDFVDSKTGGTYASQVDQGQAFLKDQLQPASGTPEQPHN